MELDDITAAIVDASMQIHKELGPGLLESVYEAVLAVRLNGVVCRSSGRKRSDLNMMAWSSTKVFGLICW